MVVRGGVLKTSTALEGFQVQITAVLHDSRAHRDNEHGDRLLGRLTLHGWRRKEGSVIFRGGSVQI